MKEEIITRALECICQDLSLRKNAPWLFELRLRSTLEEVWEEAMAYGIDIAEMNG